MRAMFQVLLWTAFTILAPLAAAQSGEAPTAIVVLDGSGSMGGPLEGQEDVKFDMASRALLQLLPTADPQARTGLVTFGNRRKGDCSDADVAIPAGNANSGQFTSVFSRIGPTGKGPLVLGVRNAAKSLPPDAPAAMIVIHDDFDNCRQDVCAAAADIAKSNPKLAIHVITISLDKTISEKMSCLAKTTGGRSFEARDAASVQSAVAEALQLAKVMTAIVSPQAERPAAPAPAAEPAGPPSIRLSAALKAGGAPLTAPVQWRILSAATPAQVIKEASVPILTTELVPGSYVVEAVYGKASSRQTIAVADRGQTQVSLSLEAALLKISMLAGGAANTLISPVLTVSAIVPAAGQAAIPTPLYIGHEASAELVLPAGAYRIGARDGLTFKQQDVTLAAGDSTPVDFGLATGRLELWSQNRIDGDTLDGTLFVLSVDDPDAPQGRREVARSIAPRPDFVLPAGTYQVTAKLGAAESKERVAVGTGDAIKRGISLNGAWTAITVLADAGLVAKGSPVVVRILSQGKDARELSRINMQAGSGPADVFLPQGKYRFEAKVGRLNVIGITDADVIAGPKSGVSVAVAAGELTVLPAPGAAIAPSWDLRDSQGQVVQRSAASIVQKVLLVAPGRYLVRMQSGDSHVDKPVDLKSGERRSLALTAE